MKTRTAAVPTPVNVVVVALAVIDGELNVFLNDGLPTAGKRADESLERCAQRALTEGDISDVADTAAVTIELQLGAYESGTSITVAYVAAVREQRDAERFQPVASLGRGRVRARLESAHETIVRDAHERVRRDLETTGLALAFVPATFSLSQLRIVYESVWGVAMDGANFRRTLTPDDGWVISTGKRTVPGSGGGKPAELYRAGRGWKQGTPIRRPLGSRPTTR